MLENSETIQDKDGNTYTVAPDEEYRQCFDPNDKPRSQLPPFWFLSRSGVLIKVSSKGWLRMTHSYKDKDKHGRAYCQVHTERINGKKKNLSWGALLNLVWDGKRFGRAQEILDEKGIYAFSNGYKDGFVHCHHINGIHDDSPENTVIVPCGVHTALNTVLKMKNSPEGIANWCKNHLMNIADVEAPGKLVKLYSGKVTDKNGNECSDSMQTIEAMEYKDLLEGLTSSRYKVKAVILGVRKKKKPESDHDTTAIINE